MAKDSKDQYDAAESQKRFNAALKGARITGHKPMSAISPKADKPRPKKTRESSK